MFAFASWAPRAGANDMCGSLKRRDVLSDEVAAGSVKAGAPDPAIEGRSAGCEQNARSRGRPVFFGLVEVDHQLHQARLEILLDRHYDALKAPVGKGPYYAAKIQMGDLGTFAGIGINERSDVITEEGIAVPCLLAVAAAAVCVFGGGYPGYGSHIGPALVFGYRAGRDIARLAAERTGSRPSNLVTP